MHLSWGNSSGSDPPVNLPMQDSSGENQVPSTSATSPLTSSGTSDRSTLPGSSPKASKTEDGAVDANAKPLKTAITSKPNESVARLAKREISKKVREDWKWPPASLSTEGDSSHLDDSREWRERDSDSEYSPPSPGPKADPYRFDNPESVEEIMLSRKRRKRVMLEEEMQWNEGLRVFQERRNAWAGAKQRPMSPRPTLNIDQPPAAISEGAQLPTPPSPSSHHTSSSPPSPARMLIPIAPPILPPDNPIRASIQPATYPSIYDKIIIRGLSPTIPINLRDVVHALVAGWKKDGEWPPKSEADRAGATNEFGVRGGGRRLARKGVGRVKKALGLGRGMDDSGGAGRTQED